MTILTSKKAAIPEIFGAAAFSIHRHYSSSWKIIQFACLIFSSLPFITM